MKKSYLKIFIAAICLPLASCLDDDKQPLDPSGAQNFIEFADLSVPSSPAGAIYPAYNTAFAISPEDGFEAIIAYSGPNNNDKDIAVNLEVDPLALVEYNAQMEELEETVLELLPDENYDIPNLTFTIPKGQKTVAVPITVYPDKFDLQRKFAIPLRIVSASSGTLSAHFSTVMLRTIAKNKYDALYDVNIEFQNWNYVGVKISDKPQDYPEEIGLVTTGPNTVGIANTLRNDDLLPGFAENADGSTSATGFGAASPVFEFDLTTDKLIGVTNSKPDDGRGRAFAMNPAAPAEHNVFDPVEREITLNFIFKQNGRPDAVQIWKMEFDSER